MIKECSLCGNIVEIYQRNYKGKKYCSTCYAYLFKKIQCSICGENQRIYRYLNPPVCQKCEQKDQPCIRCDKQNYSIGKITEEGIVCNSCSKYYRPKKSCFICNKTKHNVSRRLLYNEMEPICDTCFNKKYFISCCRCKQRAQPFLCDLERNTYCRSCIMKPDKNCFICDRLLPGGHHSNTCAICHAQTRFRKILYTKSLLLSNEAYDLYVKYADWLLKKKGIMLVNRQIIKDYQVFNFLEKWRRQYCKWPSYEEYAEALTVKKTRTYLLVTKFLQEKRIIIINTEIKSQIADKNTIDRLLERIPKYSELRIYLDNYYVHMLHKYEQGKISIRSFRLALTPAVSMLELGLLQNKKQPDMELVRQYLWLHYGQFAAITGFVNFLKLQISIYMPRVDDFHFKRPTSSRQSIKQKLISLLRSTDISIEQYIYLAMEYYHGIRMPEELKYSGILAINYIGEWITIFIKKETIFLPNFRLSPNAGNPYMVVKD